MSDIKPGDTVRIDMGAEIIGAQLVFVNGAATVKWHNGDFVGLVPEHAITRIPGSETTVAIEMGAVVDGYMDAARSVAMVHWHNSDFHGPVPVHAFTKVLPGPSRTGMPRTLIMGSGMQMQSNVAVTSAGR